MQVLQHAWTYRPMVHDVLGMSLNKITMDADPPQACPYWLMSDRPCTAHDLPLICLNDCSVLLSCMPAACNEIYDCIFTSEPPLGARLYLLLL